MRRTERVLKDVDFFADLRGMDREIFEMRFRDRIRAGDTLSRDGCWRWDGPVSTTGYGVFSWNGDVYAAHRASYCFHVGKAGDLFVCHRCDNPPCVNSAHMFLGTHEDNLQDAQEKGRLATANDGVFVKGHTRCRRNLNDSEAKRIKELIADRRDQTLRDIAETEYVPYYTVRDIASGRSYLNV